MTVLGVQSLQVGAQFCGHSYSFKSQIATRGDDILTCRAPTATCLFACAQGHNGLAC
jgi:hypothetical protein